MEARRFDKLEFICVENGTNRVKILFYIPWSIIEFLLWSKETFKTYLDARFKNIHNSQPLHLYISKPLKSILLCAH
jgi:hypothetical protein